MRVFAIDPGNVQSAYCIIDVETLRPLDFGKVENEELRDYIKAVRFVEEDRAAIETLANFGNVVGRDVLDTAIWIGRFAETLDNRLAHPAEMVRRTDEKMHICGSTRAKDKDIRLALIDRFCTHDFTAGKGTKKNPDFFYGFRADIWSAYSVGLTYIETQLGAS